MIDDMIMRHSSRETQRNYIGDVGRFATFLGRPPDTAMAADLHRSQVEQRELYRVVVEAAQAAEIAKRVGPHTLRHSFATHLVRSATA